MKPAVMISIAVIEVLGRDKHDKPGPGARRRFTAATARAFQAGRDAGTGPCFRYVREHWRYPAWRSGNPPPNMI